MMEPSALTWSDYSGDGHFSSPGKWRAEFVNSDFVPAPNLKNKMNGGTRVIGPGVVAVPGFWGHGSCFRYSVEKDAWEEYDMEARRIVCVWNRYDYKGERVTMGQTVVPPGSESPREEPVEPSSFSKLTSFLFGEREEAPTEEEAAAPVVAEAEEEGATEQPPPPPAKRWFSRESPKAEEMHQRVGCWYTFAPEAAALRAAWGEYPGTPDALQAWPGFVQVTNAFLDAKLDAKLA